jgi:hypothetical protein
MHTYLDPVLTVNAYKMRLCFITRHNTIYIITPALSKYLAGNL